MKKQSEAPGFHPMGIEYIKTILPHRYPFLLVDKIIEARDTFIVGIKNLTSNETFFQGHFPERPVMPGVLIIEALAQVGGVLLLSKPENRKRLAYLASVDSARFRKIVVPGDQLRLEVELLKFKSKFGIVKGTAKVDGDVVCAAEIMFSLGD